MSEAPNILHLIEAGLRLEAAQRSSSARNLANVSTPGFRRCEADFEAFLAEAMAAEPGRLDAVEAELFEPRTTPVNGQGNDVDMDLEVGQLVKSSVRYRTFLRLLGTTYRQMELAIRSE